MLLRKQKQDSVKRLSHTNVREDLLLLAEYRSLIVPVEFTLRQVQNYGCFTSNDLQNIENSSIYQQSLKELVVDALKLSFIYDPLLEALQCEDRRLRSQYQLKTILRILLRGEFYRFIRNNQNQLRILINNRTTQANVKILVSGLLVYSARRLSIQDISTALLFFTLQAALYDSEQLCIPFDTQKIIKVLRKIERVIKPLQFKNWLQAIKTSKDYKGQVEAHHFLLICSLTQRKFINGLGSIIFKPKIQLLYKNLNINLKPPEFQHRQTAKEGPEEQSRYVRGLSFVESNQKQQNFSKEILKEFRLNNPSKNKRPNTAELRRHASAHIPSHFIEIPPHRENCLMRGEWRKIQRCLSSNIAKFNIKLQKQQKKLIINHLVPKKDVIMIKKEIGHKARSSLKLNSGKKPFFKQNIVQSG